MRTRPYERPVDWFLNRFYSDIGRNPGNIFRPVSPRIIIFRLKYRNLIQ